MSDQGPDLKYIKSSQFDNKEVNSPICKNLAEYMCKSKLKQKEKAEAHLA